MRHEGANSAGQSAGAEIAAWAAELQAMAVGSGRKIRAPRSLPCINGEASPMAGARPITMAGYAGEAAP